MPTAGRTVPFMAIHKQHILQACKQSAHCVCSRYCSQENESYVVNTTLEYAEQQQAPTATTAKLDAAHNIDMF